MKNKKDLLGGLIIVVLLLLVLVTYMSFYNLRKEEDRINEENKLKDNSLAMINIYDDYSTFKIANKDNVDNSKSILGTYNCKNDDCSVYVNESLESIYDNKYLIVKENDKVFIYDFLLNKVVSDYYDEVVYNLNNNYLVVKRINKYGVISRAGLSIVDTLYDEINYDAVYDSYIKVKNNNLYGVLDLDNGNIIIDLKYKDLNITDSKYYSIFKDDLWYVIDENENILTNGYKYVFSFNKGFIALKDNNLEILKYNKEIEELLNDRVIPIYEENGYEIIRNGNVIDININTSSDIIKYQYNINRNNLINK